MIFYHQRMISILISFFLSIASAQQGPTIDAMAGAGIASRHPIDAAILNPAALASFEEYYFGAGFFRGKTASGSMDQASITLADATSGGFLPGAFTYRYRKYADGADLKEHVFRLSLAIPLWRNFTAGVAGYKIKSDLATGADYSQENVDLSFMWVLTPTFTWGAITKGVFGSKSSAAFIDSKVMPSSGTGFEYMNELYKLRADINYYHVNNPGHKMSYHFGTEAQMLAEFKLRAGLSVDDYHGENRYSAGLGWDGPRLRAAYTLQKEFRKELGASHSIDFWIYL